MKPETRRAILNFALCCHNQPDPNPARIERIAKALSRYLLRDPTLTPAQDSALFAGYLATVDSVCYSTAPIRARNLNRAVTILRRAASYPDQPFQPVIWGFGN